jgi:hypothetical protein
MRDKLFTRDKQERYLCLVATIVAVAFSLIGCGSSNQPTNSDRPTPTERMGLKAAVRSWARYAAPVKLMRISLVNRSWARVVVANEKPEQDILFHLTKAHWKIAYIKDIDQRADGACAFAPAAVIRTLYGTKCPSWRALHARRATKREANEMLRAYFDGPPKMPDKERRDYSIANPCVSRLDKSWAGAGIGSNQGAGQVFFFRRINDHWKWVSPPPLRLTPSVVPKRIILSLAACGGFSAALYGT